MNYKEKYKEMKKRVLAIGQGYVKEVDYSSPRSIAEYIDPYLKESEDERIRQDIIDWLINYKDNVQVDLKDEEVDRWVSCLEKQGEQENLCDKCRKEQPSHSCQDITALGRCALEKQGEQKVINEYNEHEPTSYEIEKWNESYEKGYNIGYMNGKNEQKPTDKAEPKFKVGDWIVYNRNDSSREILYVYDIRDGRYYFNDNIHFSWSVKECEEKSHFWTIQDAKDGDVLSYNDGHGNDCIELIKSITDKKIEFWFCLTNGNQYEVFDGVVPYTNLASREDAAPTTKEQRDLLFQKIKEAGYEWDGEKKELKKIEQKTAEWSEEDEKMFDKIYSVLHQYGYASHPEVQLSSNDAVKLIVWLKYLKDRVQPQPKQDWSEEDKEMLYNCLGLIQEIDFTQEEQNWLKSLIKPQNRWKPSEQNIKDLEWCADLVKDKMGVGFHRLQVFIDDLKKL